MEDFVCGLVPDEGLRIVVPGGDPGADRGYQLLGRAVAAAAQPALGQFCEPALDEVQPGAVGRREVKDEARMTKQPAVYRRGLVRGGVVDDHVHVEALRNAA